MHSSSKEVHDSALLQVQSAVGVVVEIPGRAAGAAHRRGVLRLRSAGASLRSAWQSGKVFDDEAGKFRWQGGRVFDDMLGSFRWQSGEILWQSKKVAVVRSLAM